MCDVDKVELSLPAKKEYARLLRLAITGIASRMEFTVDSLEDIKIALEEAYLLALSDPEQKRFDVIFEIYPDRLEVLVTGLGKIESLEEQQSKKFGFSILNSVMDDVKWLKSGGISNLRMVKKIQK
ncbi:MAG: hypothetical protein K6T91_04955 [Firmicutes bacterium]|nr:hypothetical protein [Bacillota bacterium]